jgi:hypothetical protein
LKQLARIEKTMFSVPDHGDISERLNKSDFMMRQSSWHIIFFFDYSKSCHFLFHLTDKCQNKTIHPPISDIYFRPEKNRRDTDPDSIDSISLESDIC